MDIYMLGKLMELIANANDLSGGKLSFIAGPLKDLLTKLSLSNGRSRHIWLNRFKRFLRGEPLCGNMVKVPAKFREYAFDTEFKDELLRAGVEFRDGVCEAFEGYVCAVTIEPTRVFPTQVRCTYIQTIAIDAMFMVPRRIDCLCVPLHVISHLICLQPNGEEKGILSIKSANYFFVARPRVRHPMHAQDQEIHMVCLWYEHNHWKIRSIPYRRLQEQRHQASAGSLFFTPYNPDHLRCGDGLGSIDDRDICEATANPSGS